VYVRVTVYELSEELLAAYLSEAPKLPYSMSIHCLVGAVNSSGDPVITLYLTAWPLDGDSTRQDADTALEPYGEPLYVGPDGVFPYSETPAFDPPEKPPTAPSPSEETRQPLMGSFGDRDKVYGGTSSVLIRAPQEPGKVAQALISAYQRCPSRMCRLDFQHAGGVSGGGTAPPSMAFGLRDWEWNAVFYSFWLAGTSSGQLENEWVTETATAMEGIPGLVSGRYAVDIANHGPVPDQEEFREAESAYGYGSDGRPNIDRLCEIKQAIDPKAVLRKYYRLCRTPDDAPSLATTTFH